MYPELKKAGGLPKALDLEFAKINSALRVGVDNDLNIIPFTYARIENGSKFSQVYIAAKEKLYLPDFWRNGVCLAHAQTGNISQLAKVIDFWLCHDVSTSVLAEKYNFVQPSPKAKALDENKEVEYTWNCLLLEEDSELSEFIKLAGKDEILNKLFPFTSLCTLCFSRCTGYPYDTDDLPNVTPKQFEQFATQNNRHNKISEDELFQNERIFVVTKNKKEYLGEGNAAEALKLVRNNLAGNIKPAIKGTADD
jgi:hypothetical protein